MFKRTLISIASAAALAGVVVPANASSGFGFDPWYVENPYGREVPQSDRSAATALGFDPWYVPGQYEGNRTATASDTSTKERSARTNLGFDPWYVENPYGSDRFVDLEDGDKVLVQRDGRMLHYDAAGHRIAMRDGVTMAAKDGSTLTMSNHTFWQGITGSAGSDH